MKVTEHIARRKSTLFSFEILPPLKGKGIAEIYAGIDPLMEFKPSFINVTYHREEIMYKQQEGDLVRKIPIRKRPGTVGICAAIMNRYHVDAVPHLICGGFTREETENALIDLQFLGIDNVLALRGDPVSSESSFIPEKGGHRYATELIQQINRMNRGIYLNEEVENANCTAFCIGAAGYPEKHYESMSKKTDLSYLRQKVDAGAEFIVTQMFFDNQKYFDFVKQCRSIGITVPIIPGLKPVTTRKHIGFLPKTFFVDFPDELADELIRCKSDEDVRRVGIEWCIAQSRELIAAGAPCLHFYTMGRSTSVSEIAAAVY